MITTSRNLAGMSATMTREARIQFNVANVTPSTERLPCMDLKSALDRAIKKKLLVCPDANRKVVRDADFHPLIAAAALAFKQHYPLVLSPDMIWLTILQGVAQHIQNDAEDLRPLLVRHQTKIELVVDTNLYGPPTNDAEMLGLSKAFVAQIARHVLPDKQSLFQAEFTTTSDTDRIVASVVIMDAFQPYFDYVFMCICGIPSVILEGTVDDWRLLGDKVRALDQSDLDLSWWTEELMPLCEQFVRASSGDVDSFHWNNLLKVMQRYGTDDLNGWILKFIPYVRESPTSLPVRENPVLESSTYDGLEDGPEDSPYPVVNTTGCTSKMLPTGISSVPVTCVNSATGKQTSLLFLAGFTAVEQSATDLSLRPLAGWAIAEPEAADLVIERLRNCGYCPRPRNQDYERILRNFRGCLPGEIGRFYNEFDGVALDLKRPNRWKETHCQILDLQSVKPLWDGGSTLRELKDLLSPGEMSTATMSEFLDAYGHMLRIASTSSPTGITHYLYGRVATTVEGVYRWTGELRPDAVTRVAESFMEWLAMLVDAAEPAEQDHQSVSPASE